MKLLVLFLVLAVFTACPTLAAAVVQVALELAVQPLFLAFVVGYVLRPALRLEPRKAAT